MEKIKRKSKHRKRNWDKFNQNKSRESVFDQHHVSLPKIKTMMKDSIGSSDDITPYDSILNDRRNSRSTLKARMSMMNMNSATARDHCATQSPYL